MSTHQETVLELRNDLTEAMKSGNVAAKTVIRQLMTSLSKESKAKMRELTEDETLSVIVREEKQYKEAYEAAVSSGRAPLIAKSLAEWTNVKAYLPEPLLEEEVEAMISASIATGNNNLGKVMKDISPKIKGRFDLGYAREMVEEAFAD